MKVGRLEDFARAQARVIMGTTWRRTLAMIVLIPVWLLSFLVPRKSSLWVLGTWEGLSYSDNSRHLHAWLHANEKDRIRAVWITRRPELARELRTLGAEAQTPYTLAGIWTCLRASQYIYTHTADDICIWLSGRATRTNLWHGIPLKKINFDNRFDRYRHARGFKRLVAWPHRFKRLIESHRVLAPSESVASLFAGAFRVDPSRIMIHGYPRNDRLVSPDFPDLLLSKEATCLERVKNLRRQGSKIVLYMPTFRRNEQTGQYREALNAEQLDSDLARLNCHFLIKAHPMSTDFSSFSAAVYQRIIRIPSDLDPYLILPLVDLLVTDYSSIFYDFLVLDRPLIFYPFDMDHYQKMERELYFDYEAHVPGPIARSYDELRTLLNSFAANNGDAFVQRRKVLLNQMFPGYGSVASPQITASLVSGQTCTEPRHA